MYLMEQIEIDQGRAVTSPDEVEEEDSYAPGAFHVPLPLER